MKNYLLLLSLLLAVSLGVNAQYRCIPFIQVSGAPDGDVGSDFYLGYYFHDNLQDVTPAWFPIHKIPFPFYFNGQLVQYYKISNTGILTFDTAAVTPPQFMHPALPSALIPNQSVCVAGLRCSEMYITPGSTDYPEYPQKLWATFYTAYDSTSQHQTEWSIVLEDSTNNIYLVNHYNGTGLNAPLTLGLQVNSNTAYRVPGPANVINPGNANGSGAGYPVYYAFIPGSNLVSDGAVISGNQLSYYAVNHTPVTIKTLFKNLGADTVTSVQLHYTVNGGAPVSQTFTGLSLATGYQQWFTFSSAWAPSAAGNYHVKIYCSNLSSGPDQDTSNNYFTQTIGIADSLPKLRPLFEEMKGTWCSNAGYWTQNYDTILYVNTTSVSSIKYESYNGTLSWNTQDYQIRTTAYNTNFVPAAISNGQLAPQPGGTVNYYDYIGNPWNVTQHLIDSLKNLPGIFTAVPKFYRRGNYIQGNITVTAALHVPATIPCRIFSAVIEDTIFQPWAVYNSNEKLFVNTTRRMFPDANGVSIGNPISGHTDSLNFVYLVTDTGCNINRLHLVTFVQDMNTMQILQSAEVPITPYNLPVPPMPLVTGDSLFCAGTHANLTVTNTCTGCRYNWSNGDTGTTVTINATGNYTVTAINNNGTTRSNAYSVTEITTPGVPEIVGDSFVCTGEYDQLSVNNTCTGCSYYWESPFIFATTSEIFGTPGTDTVYVQNVCGINKATFTIFGTEPAPSIPIISGDTAACTTHPITLMVTDPCNGCWYKWSNNVTGDSIHVTNSGRYTVSASNGCATYQSIAYNVTSLSPPAPVISGDTLLCAGGQVVISVANACSGCSYTWTDNVTALQITVTTTGVYSVEASNNCGTGPSASVTVSTPAVPGAPAISGNDGICPQQQDILYVNNACTGCTYNWNTGVMGDSLTTVMAGVYTVTVSNICNQTVSNTFTVAVNGVPQPVISATGNVLTVSDSETVTYQWYINDTTVLTGDTLNTFIPGNTGYYSVLATNNSGCSSMSASRFYQALGIPTLGLSDLQVYPTVTADNVNVIINGNTSGLNYTLTALNGKVLGKGLIPASTSLYNINLSQVANGVYLLNLFRPAGTAVFKVIKID